MNTEELLKPDADRNLTDQPEVQEAITQIAQKQIDDLADYVADFIAKRFPQGLPAEWHNMIAEMVLDSFHDGARWAEATKREESRIITQL